MHDLALNVTLVKPAQELKAPLPIDVTELGIVTEVSFEQPENALSPIHVTELGIVSGVSFEQR